MLHLHGLEHKERLAPSHTLARSRGHLDDLAGHRRRETSACRIELHLRLQRIDIGQAMLDAVEQDHRGVARLQQSGAMDRAIQTEDEIATLVPSG